MELLQAIPEAFPLAHGLGEIVRNLGYATAAAYIFHFAIVELPQMERTKVALRTTLPTVIAIIEAPSRLARVFLRVEADQAGHSLASAEEARACLRSVNSVASRNGVSLSFQNYIAQTSRSIIRSVSDVRGQFAYLPPDLQQALTQMETAAQLARSIADQPGEVLALKAPLPTDSEVDSAMGLLVAAQAMAISLSDTVTDKSAKDRLRPYTAFLIP